MKIYYGNGQCSIQAKNIVTVVMMVKYPVEIYDKTPDAFTLMAGNNKIIIGLIGTTAPDLGELFEYVGNLHIISCTCFDKEGQEYSVQIVRVLDYSELLTTKAEDMTLKAENMNASSVYQKNVSKMKVYPETIDNLYSKGGRYLETGEEYIGYIHIHRETFEIMTGATHTTESQSLYFKDLYGKSDQLKLISHKNIRNSNAHKLNKYKGRLRGVKR